MLHRANEDVFLSVRVSKVKLLVVGQGQACEWISAVLFLFFQYFFLRLTQHGYKKPQFIERKTNMSTAKTVKVYRL